MSLLHVQMPDALLTCWESVHVFIVTVTIVITSSTAAVHDSAFEIYDDDSHNNY